MADVIILQSLIGKFFADVTQIFQKHLVCAPITIEARRMLCEKLS